MKILYLDTSSSFLYIGIVDNNKLVIEVKKELGKDLSVYTLSEIEKVFQTINMQPNDIDKIIVVNGPGSFTGIRIGVTIAKTFAWSLKKKITTISSLDAMALSVSGYDYIIPYIDARRDCGYTGIYNKENQIIFPNTYIALSDLKDKLKDLNNYVVITNDEIDINNKVCYSPDILKIVNYYENKTDIDPHMVSPNYLKLTEAEEKRC